MILLVGTSQMAIDYAKVLKNQKLEYLVVGRGQANADKFEEATGVAPITGGVESIDSSFIACHSITKAIVATSVDTLADVSSHLMSIGVKSIMLEKPAAIDLNQLNTLHQTMTTLGGNIYVAYNRRFYASVARAREIIREDGRVENFHFEITEWGHIIKDIPKDKLIKNNWFFANTTHVVDLAFHLGGSPAQLSSFTAGTSEWHERSYVYAGAGVSDRGALFSYNGNWGAPGRWSLEVLTNKHRLIFKPMEKLKVQELGSVVENEVELYDELDIEFKPGLFNQVTAFVQGDETLLCRLTEHLELSKSYKEMAGY